MDYKNIEIHIWKKFKFSHFLEKENGLIPKKLFLSTH